ncbi:MAG TPA: helix-turn-helix transcriptional regulator [Rectinemataceae bacterium]|nr:helix-turn-helix transcriptional regulator [Rectinemataceae bacterium]
MLAFLMSRLAEGQTHPETGKETPLPRIAADLEPIRVLLDARSEEAWTLAALARKAGYSRYHFLRSFRAVFHETPLRYLSGRRLAKAKRLLADTDLTVTEICCEVGFESLGSFSTLFLARVGWSPSVYRARVLAQRSRPLDHIPACHIGRYGLGSISAPASNPREAGISEKRDSRSGGP